VAGTAPGIRDNGQGDGAAHILANDTDGDADQFDLNSLRLSQDFAATVGVKKLLTTVPVRKPSKEWFVRTHPDPKYRPGIPVIESKEDREIYLVAKSLWPALGSESTFSPRLLVVSINRQGVLFIWPIRLPGTDGKLDPWNRSAMEAVERAQSRWIRIAANMSLGAYEMTEAPGQVAEPTWPEKSAQEIFDIAFKDRRINTWEHPILRRLRGEA
jgi:hypothetical protein